MGIFSTKKIYTFVGLFIAQTIALNVVAQVAQPTPITPTPAPAAAQPAPAPTPAPQPAAAQPKFTVPPIIHPADPIGVVKKKKPKPATVATTTPIVTPPAASKATPITVPMPIFRNPFEKRSTAPAPPPAAVVAPPVVKPPAAAVAPPVVTPPTPQPVAQPTDTAKAVAAVIDTTYKGNPNNPFELPRNAVKSAGADVIIKGKPSLSNANISNAPREAYSSPFKKIFNKMDNNPVQVVLFVVLSFMVIFLAFVMTVFQQQVRKIWGAFGNEQALASLYREQGTRTNVHFIVIYSLFVLSAGVFFYQIARHFGAPMGGAMLGILICMAGVTLIVMFRHILLKIIAAIFPFYKEINQYSFTISIFHQALGLILVPFVIFVAFAPPSLQTLGIYAGIGIITLVYLYRSIRGLIIGSKFLLEYRFHFLLYLCAIELAPLAILIKVFIGNS